MCLQISDELSDEVPFKLVDPFHHSHKKQKESLETRAVYIEIPLVS